MLGTPGETDWNRRRRAIRFQLRARIRDGEKVLARPIAEPPCDLLVEVLVKDVWLERVARLAGDDEQTALQIHRGLHPRDLRRVRGIQHVEAGCSVHRPEAAAQDVRTQAGPAHAEHDGVGEVTARGQTRQRPEVACSRLLGRHDVEPAQPAGLACPGPQRRVLAPQPSDAALLLPHRRFALQRRRERLGTRDGLTRDRRVAHPVIGHWSLVIGQVAPPDREGTR